MNASIDEILRYWFGAPGEPEWGQPRRIWFAKSQATDAEIALRFGASVEAALAGELDGWAAEPEGLLALAILLDQFPRNLFRGQARAFAGDAAARALASRAVAAGWDAELAPLRRVFLYLPFEHGEAAADQDQSLRLFRQLESYPETRGFLRWAEEHAAVISRFGRFPHRNAALGRENTPEEQDYLAQPGAGF
ncbi:MAG: DUF924 domain-containing protein [Gammaproteobacteria bacterium]|nr:DUF924 domain-containing protein [Gammaproteobacteria bacterium]